MINREKSRKLVFGIFFLQIFPLILLAQEKGFIVIPQGEYSIGHSQVPDNPVRKVKTESFLIASTELTNADFEKFVQATSYQTLAERFRNAQVFEPGLEEFRWLQDSTAYWRYPNGISRGGIENKMNHPVTCISYKDAIAYCEWANVRLPTLDEWEISAKAGSTSNFSEGITPENISEFANIWLGKNHLEADTSDGFMYTSPVGSFKPNAWGLYDVFGNVFEFCEGSLPRDNGRFVAHARGGSWWCSKNACSAYNSFFVGSVNPNASFSNLGFRVVKK